MRQRKRTIMFVFILSVCFFSNYTLLAQEYAVEDGKAFFKAKMPLNSYTGESNELKGKVNFETGLLEFSLSVKSIKTGIDKRDGHMYKLLKVDENPNVIFKGKFIENYDPAVKTKQVLKAKGDFTLAGITREIFVDVELIPEGKAIRLTSSWSLMITEYNIERPSKFFFKVDDKHQLGVNILLEKEK
jgi:polyisoprenoid-binding protein YceI